MHHLAWECGAMRLLVKQNSRRPTVVWIFAILCEGFKRLASLRDICMWHNGYFTSSAAAVLVRCPGRLSPPSVVCYVQRPWAQRPLTRLVCLPT